MSTAQATASVVASPYTSARPCMCVLREFHRDQYEHTDGFCCEDYGRNDGNNDDDAVDVAVVS